MSLRTIAFEQLFHVARRKIIAEADSECEYMFVLRAVIFAKALPLGPKVDRYK
jgi:hypothetical protein